ncbi:MAG: sugar ABC transporter substrate-binding protein [Lachnospiraceae bacterium]|nr:sugar ABC transporter substrate-binding protein [Lachnospiraceae bacterium]MCI9546376.1 sugar ABC transporter substrate-binding protein [Lachnospiraceae bacterium]
MGQKKRLFVWIFVLLLAAVSISGGIFYSGNRPGKGPEGHKPLKFGATYMTMNNPYFSALNESIREVVESNGDILITRDPAQDQKRQNAQIQEMLDEGVAGIFVNPVDWEEITPALQACHEAQVPVFNVDTDVKEPKYVATVIQSDNYQAGVQCARDMMAKRDSARIVIMNHYNIRSTIQRVQGFLDTIEGHPAYQVVEEKSTTSELEVAMEVMKQILDTDLKFDVVLGGNDPTALGALAALQMCHVEDRVMIYGIDGSPDSKAMIQQGYMEGTSAQRPIRMGRISAQAAYNYLEGKKIKKNITVEVTLITRDNLDEFDVDGWQ